MYSLGEEKKCILNCYRRKQKSLFDWEPSFFIYLFIKITLEPPTDRNNKSAHKIVNFDKWLLKKITEGSQQKC